MARRKATHKKGKRKGTRRTAVGGWFWSKEETPEEKAAREKREREEAEVKKWMAEYDPEKEKKNKEERNRIRQQEEEEKRQKENALFQELMEAVKKGDEAKVKEVLKNKPNINRGDENGFAPLHHAVIQGNRPIVSLLIDYIQRSGFGTEKMAIDVQDKYFQTPLLFAYLHKHYDIAKMLIDAGADINRRGLNNDNLIMRMVKLVEEGSDIPVTVEMIEKMREDGANPYTENKKGFSTIAYINMIMDRSPSRELLGQMRTAMEKIYTMDGARKIRSWGGSRKKKRGTRRATRRSLS